MKEPMALVEMDPTHMHDVKEASYNLNGIWRKFLVQGICYLLLFIYLLKVVVVMLFPSQSITTDNRCLENTYLIIGHLNMVLINRIGY